MTTAINFPLTTAIPGKDGTNITEITFNEPTLGDHILAEKFQTDGSYSAALMSGMSGLDLDVIHKMSLPDFKKAIQVLEPLMGNDRKTDGST